MFLTKRRRGNLFVMQNERARWTAVRTMSRTLTSRSRTRARTVPRSELRAPTASPSSRASRATRSSASAARAAGQNRTRKTPRTRSSSAVAREARARAVVRAGREAREARAHLQSVRGRADGWRSAAGHSAIAIGGSYTAYRYVASSCMRTCCFWMAFCVAWEAAYWLSKILS